MDSDLIRGNVDTIIMKCLVRGEMYGFEICKLVKELSGGTYDLKQPTLYSALNRLKSRGYIVGTWKDSPIGGRRHYFALTEKGRSSFDCKRVEWQFSKLLIDNLVLEPVAVKKESEQISVNLGGVVASEQIVQHSPAVELVPVASAVAEKVEAENNVVVSTKPISPIESYNIKSKFGTCSDDTYVASKEYVVLPLSNAPRVSDNAVASVNFAAAGKPAELQPYILHPYNVKPETTAVSNFAESSSDLYKKSVEIASFFGVDLPATAKSSNSETVLIKPFVKHSDSKKSGKFVLYTKLRLIASLLVCAVLVAGLVAAYNFLKSSYTMQENFFFGFGGAAIAVYLLANIALFSVYPKYKKVLGRQTVDILRRVVLSACVVVAVVSLNVIAGLSQINAADFLVYWVVPSIVGTAFLLEGLVILAFKRNRLFLV